jgi:hypothetical protein
MATSSDPPSPNPGTNPSKVLSTMDEDRDSVSDFRNWAEIQRDVLVSVFEKVGMIGVLSSAELVCSPWRKASKEESRLWRRIHVGMDGKTTDVTEDKLKTMLKRAVDRSTGALEEFWISRCCDAKLLRYTGARLVISHFTIFLQKLKLNFSFAMLMQSLDTRIISFLYVLLIDFFKFIFFVINFNI